LASVIRVYLYPACPQASTLAIRHIAMMGWILKATLRGESSESQQAVLRVMLPDERDFQWLASHPKTSVAVTYRLRQICSHMLESLIDRSSSSAIKFVIEDKIGSLEEVVGGCERLFGSPIPPTYSRHLSRVVVMWVLLLPMSLLSSPGLSTLGISIATAVGTYVLVGIDEVGMEIENVFQMLPLQQLAGAVQNDVRDQFIPKQGEMPRVIL
jgi:putative membrane protein